jgi:DNA topoisomerase-3
VARELIKTGRTEKPVTGFKGKSGKSFRARLALQQNEEGKWRVEFDEPWARDGAGTAGATGAPPEAEDTAAESAQSGRSGSRSRRAAQSEAA